MWAEGNQERKLLELASNEDLLKLEGYLEDKEAKVSLYEFLRNNITFASSLILGVDLAPMQHMMIKTFLNTDYSLAVISRGGAKCINVNSFCKTNRGLIKAGDVQIGDLIQSKDSFNVVSGKIINEKQDSYVIETEGGLKSEGLDYHKILTLSPELNFEWKYNKDIKLDDYIVIKKDWNNLSENYDIFNSFLKNEKNLNSRCKKINLSYEDIKDWYYFFGLFIGDGCFLKTGIIITSEDQEIIDFCTYFFKKLNLNPRLTFRKNKCYDIRVNSVALVRFLEYLGFSNKKKGKDKEIPSLITKTSNENIALLLRGLLDTDGHCSVQTKKSKNSKCIMVGFTSSSRTLIDQFQNLALSLGLFFRKHTAFKGGDSNFNGKIYKCNKAWSIVISNQKEIKLFKEIINFNIKRKSIKLQELDNQKYQEFEFSDYVPYIGDFLKRRTGKTSKCSPRSKTKKRVKLNFRKLTSKRLLSKLLKMKWEDEEICKKLKPLLREDFIYLKVNKTYKSECVTVDLQVENEHNFISNGIINHNSFCAGVYAALDCLLNPGIKVGILAPSFRQSKQIFQYIEDISNKPQATLFKQAIGKISKGSDQWTMSIGESRIYCLPMGLGGKLRGFRFNRILVDEFLLMPESIFTEVIIPFLSTPEDAAEKQKIRTLEDKLIAKGEMEEKDRYFWPNNKLIALSSASYKFEFMYRYFQQLDYAIFQENQKSNVTRSIIQLNYECIPEQFYDRNLIEQAKLSMSQSQFDREFGALFTDDSSGYFKLSKMKNCCIPDGEKPTIEVKGEPGAEYILAFDPSWSQTESSDDFAIQILKVDKESKKSTLVHSYALSGEPLKVHIQYMLYCLDNFNIVAICGDYNGGVQFLQACNESDLFISRDLELRTIDTAFEDPEKYQQDLAQYKMKYNISEKRIVILRKPTSNWIRKANELLQANFDHKRIFFGARAIDQSYKQQISKSIPIESLKFVKSDEATNNQDKAAKMVDLVENQFDMIAKTIDQCALIQITSTAQGTQTFDLPPNLRKQTGPGKARKDSYSALVLGNWMAKIYYDSNSEQIQEVTRTFVPQFVA